METNFSKHVLMRYSDRLAPPEGTIIAHNQVTKTHGYVWMGKFGRPIAQSTIDILNEQIKNHMPTYLFLAQTSGKEYTVTAGELAETSRSLNPNESSKVPKYYRNEHKKIGGWLK